jgi:hypothetical protein
MDWHDVTWPSLDFAVILATNAPSIEMGERFAADRLSVTGCRSARENPLVRNSCRDHKSDLVPESGNFCRSIRCVSGVIISFATSVRMGWQRRWLWRLVGGHAAVRVSILV